MIIKMLENWIPKIKFNLQKGVHTPRDTLHRNLLSRELIEAEMHLEEVNFMFRRWRVTRFTNAPNSSNGYTWRNLSSVLGKCRVRWSDGGEQMVAKVKWSWKIVFSRFVIVVGPHMTSNLSFHELSAKSRLCSFKKIQSTKSGCSRQP